MDCSKPGFPVPHHLLAFAQVHVHWIGDVTQPSHPLSPSSPSALNLSQHQGFSNESALRIKWPKYWGFSFSTVLPKSTQVWFPLILTGLISLLGYRVLSHFTSVVSDSVRLYRQQPTRLPHPWDSPGKNTGVGCHFLLQCMKGKSESEVAQSCLTLSDPMDCSLPGSSVMGFSRQEYWSGVPSPSPSHNYIMWQMRWDTSLPSLWHIRKEFISWAELLFLTLLPFWGHKLLCFELRIERTAWQGTQVASVSGWQPPADSQQNLWKRAVQQRQGNEFSQQPRVWKRVLLHLSFHVETKPNQMFNVRP